MKKSKLLVFGLMLLFTSQAYCQNYYTQIVKLKDGTERRIKVDDILKTEFLKKEDLQKMSAYEYLTLIASDVDSVRTILRQHEEADGSNNLYGSVVPDLNSLNINFGAVYVPNDEAWRNALLYASGYFKSAPKLSYPWVLNGTIFQNSILLSSDYGQEQARLAVLSQISEKSGDVISTVHVQNGEVNLISKVLTATWKQDFEMQFPNVLTDDNYALNNGTQFNCFVKDFNMGYLWCMPSGNNNYIKPELSIILPPLLSARYSLYCVMVPHNPAFVEELDASEPAKPNRVVFTLNYSDQEGLLQNHIFLDENQDIEAFMSKYNIKDNQNVTNSNHQTIRAFSNDTSKIDTIYVGSFDIPVSYHGTGVGPMLKISTPFSVFNSALRNDFTRDLRIAAIILKLEDEK